MRLADRDVAIVGIGHSDAYGFDLGSSAMRLQAEAFFSALGDAGLDRADVDGFATAQGAPGGVDYEEFVSMAGLSCGYVEQAWAHGRWATGLLVHAELAIRAGLADTVAICNTFTSGRGYGRHLHRLGSHGINEGLRDCGGGHGEWAVHGTDTPGAATSLVARRYMDRYGASPDDLALICSSFREWAVRNPMAMMRDKPMTPQQYHDEPLLADPFRRCDFSLVSEGSVCLIMAAVDRAADLRQPPVALAGAQGIRADRDSFVMFSRPGLGVGFADEFAFAAMPSPALAMAGVTAADVDALYLYDSFSSNVWMVLERFGFCGEGEAPGWIAQHGMGPASPLPVNTNGGLLSEAHLGGFGHLVEMVRQLRRQAGERQLTDPAVLQWATPWGDSLVLTRS
jgi:acetyl-CoA acetyltransferase